MLLVNVSHRPAPVQGEEKGPTTRWKEWLVHPSSVGMVTTAFADNPPKHSLSVPTLAGENLKSRYSDGVEK